MSVTRRLFLQSAAIGAPLLAFGAHARLAQAATTLKISHQFPGGTIDEGDFRDRLCRKFAAAVSAKTNNALEFQFYPGSSLMKTNAQFSALRRGALDLSLFPISYAGGEVKELNIGLMPALVSSYDQALRWKKSPAGEMLKGILQDKGVVMVSWVWQAGGIASRAGGIVNPADAAGLKIRGGSREMDLMLKEAGAAVVTMPSNELYIAMQTGAVDAALTSSTSLISFRLEELAKNLTTGRDKTFWFMLEPLIMSKAIFDSLPGDQRDAIMAAGEEVESFGQEQAMKDDQNVADIFARAGAGIHDIDEAAIEKWRAVAAVTAWKDFAEKSDTCAQLIKLAEAV